MHGVDTAAVPAQFVLKQSHAHANVARSSTSQLHIIQQRTGKSDVKNSYQGQSCHASYLLMRRFCAPCSCAPASAAPRLHTAPAAPPLPLPARSVPSIFITTPGSHNPPCPVSLAPPLLARALQACSLPALSFKVRAASAATFLAAGEVRPPDGQLAGPGVVVASVLSAAVSLQLSLSCHVRQYTDTSLHWYTGCSCALPSSSTAKPAAFTWSQGAMERIVRKRAGSEDVRKKEACTRCKAEQFQKTITLRKQTQAGTDSS